MYRYFNNVTTRTGDVVPGATVTVTSTATGALAELYSDNGVTRAANPLACDNNGAFSFYAADGRYTLTINGHGIQTIVIPDVALEDAGDEAAAAAASASAAAESASAAAASAAAVSGPGGSDLVGFQQSGIGAASRTVQDKLREVVSVADFGAVGDGVTDDTAAFVLAANSGRNVRVPAGGSWFVTVTTQAQAEALRAMLARLTVEADELVLNFAAGAYAFTSAMLVKATGGERIKIKGAPNVQTTITSLGSVTGTAGAWDVVVNVLAAGDSAVGQYVVITDTTGTGTHEIHRGVWRISAVAGNALTLRNTAQVAAFPASTLTGGYANRLKTKFTFAGCDGVRAEGARLGLLVDVAIVGDGAANYSGIVCSGQDGTSQNVIAQKMAGTASITCGQFVGVCGFAEQGLLADNGGFIYARYAAACGNGKRGFYAAVGGGVHARNSVANGNGQDGYIADYGAGLWASISTACGNALNGFFAFNGGSVVADQSVASANLQNGAEARFGFINFDSATAQANTLAGMVASFGSQVSCVGAILNSNATAGLYVDTNASARANGVTCSSNTQYGVRVATYGVVSSTTAIIAAGNGTADLRRETGGALVNNGATAAISGFWMEAPRVYNPTAANYYGMTVSSVGDLTFLADGTNRVVLKAAGTVHPSVDNSQDLGRSTERWKTGYFANVAVSPGAAVTPANNGDVMFQLTSNTQLTFKVKGSDGTVRSGSITLA